MLWVQRMKNYNLSDIKLICEQTIENGRCGKNCSVSDFCKYLLPTNIPKNWNIDPEPKNEGLYLWEVEESDGYVYKEMGKADNITDAFYKAIESSPAFVEKVTIEKLKVQSRSGNPDMWNET